MITKKTKLFASLSLLFLLASSVSVFFILQYIQTQGEELVTQAKEVTEYEEREQSYRDLSQLIEETKQQREELNTHILTEEKTIDFLSNIEKLAVNQGVELVTNSLKVSEDTKFFETLTIAFSVKGMENRVYALLELLETLPYHSFVSKISLQNRDTTNVSMINGDIELTVSLLQYDR